MTSSKDYRHLTSLEKLADELGVLPDRSLWVSADVYHDDLLANVLEELRLRVSTDEPTRALVIEPRE
ncbi:MAG: hypothetical protein JWN70_5065 [Planctomycetaceae bacterium]|nr:hypothetical protein [Planctomycetaceae bacterium]